MILVARGMEFRPLHRLDDERLRRRIEETNAINDALTRSDPAMTANKLRSQEWRRFAKSMTSFTFEYTFTYNINCCLTREAYFASKNKVQKFNLELKNYEKYFSKYIKVSIKCHL